MDVQKPRIRHLRGGRGWEIEYPCPAYDQAWSLKEAHRLAFEHVRCCECLSPLRRELLRKSSDGFRILDSLLEKWIEELQTIPVLPSR